MSWSEIQVSLARMGIKGDTEARSLTYHEISVAVAALTTHLYGENQMESIRDEESYITSPKEQDWRTLKI
jgi:hypothetical protein